MDDDVSLLERICGAFANSDDKRCAKIELETFFKNAGLPLPEKGEFHRANSSFACVVFLEDYGSVIRVMTREEYEQLHPSAFIHPFLLHPLATFTGSKVVCMLYPGLHIGQTENNYGDEYNPYGADDAETNLLQNLLIARKLDCHEADKWNRGYIKGDFGKPFCKGFPLHLDPKYISELPAKYYLPDDDEEISPCLKILHERAQTQDRYFSDIKYDVLEAWAKDAMPNPSKMKALWPKLVRYKADGVLATGWTDIDEIAKTFYPDDPTISLEPSAKYALHIKKHLLNCGVQK